MSLSFGSREFFDCLGACEGEPLPACGNAPGTGGLHPVDSLVMFADTRAADRISCEVRRRLWHLSVEGPGAKASARRRRTICLWRRRWRCVRRATVQSLGVSMVLHKVLPIAGGVGGGSSDAAATLACC